MGWLRFTSDAAAEDPDDVGYDHEGWAQGIVRGEWSHEWRDLGLDDAAMPEGKTLYVQLVCSCGWRSHRLSAPAGVEWFPCSIQMDAAVEDVAAEMWWELHRKHVTKDGIADLWRARLSKLGQGVTP